MRASPRIVVIGAGPAGLGAAYRLSELESRNYALYEASDAVGGLARSFRDPAGFTWDIGGHVMFSHYDYYDRLFDRVMGEDYSLIDRESWVRTRGTWVPYPFQNNVRYLGRELACECLLGLLRAKSAVARRDLPAPADARDFAQFIDSVFGEGIARLFMRPYNFKVWAYPPEMMNKTWIGERVAVIDVERALRNVLLDLDDFGWGPNNRFKYPIAGGTGEFYRRIGLALGVPESGRVPEGVPIHLNARLLAIDTREKTLRFSNGRTDRYDALVSTIPLDRLVLDFLADVAPPDIRDAASRLRHSRGHMVGVGIRRPCPSTKSWMYFPDDDCPFYRVTYLSNYSPNMTPDRRTHYSLLCETSESPLKPVRHDTIVNDTIRGLVAAGVIDVAEIPDIVSTWHHAIEYSYPTPSVDRDEILSRLIPWLEQLGIYSRGRFGLWKYEVSNTDHSLMQGVEVIDRLLQGVPERTTGLTYDVTSDGRRAASHERPAVAGSGEKRLIEPKPAPPHPGIAGQPIGEEEIGVGG